MSNIWPPGTSLGEDFYSPAMTNCCTCCAYLVSNFVLQGCPWKVTSDIQVCLWKTISKRESSSWLSHEGHSHSWDRFFRWQDLATVARLFYENVIWYIVKLQSKSIPVQVKRTRSWLCFPPVTTRRTTRTRTTRTRTLTKIYQKEVYFRLGIWNIDLTHKIMTSPTIPGMVTHHPKVGYPPSQV